jgi:hypothetical protein
MSNIEDEKNVEAGHTTVISTLAHNLDMPGDDNHDEMGKGGLITVTEAAFGDEAYFHNLIH